MKKWIMPIAVVAICILAASVAMPICLADQHRIEIEGKLVVDKHRNSLGIDTYKIGELHEGDKIKVVISHMREGGDIKVILENTSVGAIERYLNQLYISFLGYQGAIWLMCRLPCQSYYMRSPTPAVEETTIVHAGEEKTFTVPKDGIYHLGMKADGGRVIYKGYIEVIKTEK